MNETTGYELYFFKKQDVLNFKIDNCYEDINYVIENVFITKKYEFETDELTFIETLNYDELSYPYQQTLLLKTDKKTEKNIVRLYKNCDDLCYLLKIKSEEEILSTYIAVFDFDLNYNISMYKSDITILSKSKISKL